MTLPAAPVIKVRITAAEKRSLALLEALEKDHARRITALYSLMRESASAINSHLCIVLGLAERPKCTATDRAEILAAAQHCALSASHLLQSRKP